MGKRSLFQSDYCPGTGGDPIRAKVKNEGEVAVVLVLARRFSSRVGISEAASSANSAKIFVGGNNTTVSGGSNLGAGMAKGVAGCASTNFRTS
jgi:hypothetical protein